MALDKTSSKNGSESDCGLDEVLRVSPLYPWPMGEGTYTCTSCEAIRALYSKVYMQK